LTELDALQRVERLLAERQDLSDALARSCEPIGRLFQAAEARIETAEAHAGPSGHEGEEKLHPGALRVPLLVDGGVVGRLLLDRGKGGAPFTAEDISLAQTVADRLSSALENETLRAQERERVAAEERNRIARDLHDADTQRLYSAGLIAEALPSLLRTDPAQGRANLERLRLLVRGALAETRTLLFELRPAALEEADLGALLEKLAHALAGQLQVPVEVAVAANGPLPYEVKLAFYRVAQEAFSNVAKHARARRARADLLMEGTTVIMSVRDDGRGFDVGQVAPACMGLRIMRERMEEVGAGLSLVSSPGQGTLVEASWPAPGWPVTLDPGLGEAEGRD
jgi:signal transduction histidine kinase